MKAAPVNPGPEEETKGLTLSKAFDSHEATMKLASLTGAEREMLKQRLQKPAATASPGAAPVASVEIRRDPKRAVAPRPERRASRPSYTYFWVVGALAIAIALALVLLR